MISWQTILGDAIHLASRQISATNACNICKTSDCSQEDPSLFGFSGTDSGLANMSTIVPFSVNRFKFHLKLYNKYQLLEEESVELPTEQLGFLGLSKKFVINFCRCQSWLRPQASKKADEQGQGQVNGRKGCNRGGENLVAVVTHKMLNNPRAGVCLRDLSFQIYHLSEVLLLSKKSTYAEIC